MTKIVFVDDDAGIAEMAEILLRRQICFHEGCVISSFAMAVELLPQLSPDIVVLDNRLTDGCGLDLVRLLKGAIPQSKWLMYSGYLSRNTLQRAISDGVDGAVSKSAPFRELVEAVKALLAGRRYFCSISACEIAGGDGDILTRTERQIARHISSGLSPKQIAGEMGIAHKTILNCLVALRRKIDADSFVEISDYARKHGLSELDGT